MLAFRIVPRIPGHDPVRSGSPVQPDPEALTVRTTDLGEKRGLFPENRVLAANMKHMHSYIP